MTAREHADRAHRLIAEARESESMRGGSPAAPYHQQRATALRMEAFAHSVSALVMHDEAAVP